MKKSTLFLVAMLVTLGFSANAEETAPNVNLEKTPWLKDVTLPMRPIKFSPVIPMKLYSEDGKPVPKELTEDEPIVLQADSGIFYDPPVHYDGVDIMNPSWEANPSINWQVIDWEKNRNTTCAVSAEQPQNCMVVIPTSPTKRGAITCNVGRRMSYSDPETGKTKCTFANSSMAADVKIKDITPPTCGLQITVKDGATGQIFPVENPPDHYPLPKPADIITRGALFNADPDEDTVIPGLILGKDMILSEDTALKVSKQDTISISVIGDDNYKLNQDKLRYGICNGAGGEPTPICEENQPEYDLSTINLQENPHIFLDATDMAGNREVLFIPISLR